MLIVKRWYLLAAATAVFLSACGANEAVVANEAVPAATKEEPAAESGAQEKVVEMAGQDTAVAQPTPIPAEEIDLDGLDDGEKAIALAAAPAEAAARLANYPDWTADAYPEDEEAGLWGVDFYSETADEWLGYVLVDLPAREVVEMDVPRELTAEEYQAGLEKVEAFVLRDAEVLALLGDPAQWERHTEYNRWDETWETGFYRGLDEWVAVTTLDGDDVYLEGIYDPYEFEAEQAERQRRDEAIGLAWEADGIDRALDGVDNWRAYVSPQGDNVYAVTFAAEDAELFYALVDVAAGQLSFNDGIATDLDQAELDDFVALVRTTPYRIIDECITMAVDGGRYPPEVRVSDGSQSYTFGVNDDACAESDHDYYGEVLYREDYQRIYDAVVALMGPADSSAS